MPRRVTSLVTLPPAGLSATEPVLDANAYALAEDVDLTMVLLGGAVELALAGGEVPPRDLAGVALPPSASDQDLRGLLESGIAVHVLASAAAEAGLEVEAFVDGVRLIDDDELSALLRASEAVLRW